MNKVLAFVVSATIVLFSSGFTPMSASVAEAKTSNQIKNENKGKAAKAATQAKSAASKARSKSKK